QNGLLAHTGADIGARKLGEGQGGREGGQEEALILVLGAGRGPLVTASIKAARTA
ncbi:hypothetical protein T492DRAFT_885073, partial [Pavlovales sp. CCMP2436]